MHAVVLRLERMVRVGLACDLRVAHEAFLRFASLLNPLIERLQNSCVDRGDDIHCRIEFFFSHPRFPCVRKAAADRLAASSQP